MSPHILYIYSYYLFSVITQTHHHNYIVFYLLAYEMADFNFVSDLKPFKSMWKIKVEIIRHWKQYSASDGLTIEMVLVDSNASFIYTVFPLVRKLTYEMVLKWIVYHLLIFQCLHMVFISVFSFVFYVCCVYIMCLGQRLDWIDRVISST